MTSPKRKRCAAKSVCIIGLLLLLALALSLSAAGTASSTTASGGKISSARLTKKKFTIFQTASVKLIYKFSKESTHFSYKLQIKKKVSVKEHGEWRKVTRWKQVRSAKQRGHFKGSKSMTVKKLFAGKPVNVGSYKLRLSADRGVKTLSFEVIKAKKMTQVAAGAYHTCALRSNGTVWCWGFDEDGELGDEGSTDCVFASACRVPTPLEVPGISTAIQVAGGQYHTCALLSNGTVECWGANDKGQL